MVWVTTTDFFTPYWLKPLTNAAKPLRWCVLVVFCLAWGLVCETWAQSPGAQSSPHPSLRLEMSDEAVFLTAQLDFQLPERAEDALHKGIPMYFVAQARVTRSRWYWSDRKVAEVARYMRLSYQPLTRRWRLNTSSTPFASMGQGMALGQNFDLLSDAVSTMQRMGPWRIAEASDITMNSKHKVSFSFKLDMSQLPRPLQIGALGRSEWDLLVTHEQEWSPEPNP